MEKMAAFLEESGFVVVNQGYPSRSACVEKLSEATLLSALAHPSLKKCTKIHFVTHSLGGILVRSFFKRHPHGKLGRVVMLGPPNQGSEVVDCLKDWWLFRLLNGPAGKELGTTPDSTPNHLGEVFFELGVIAGNRSLNWINSLMIPGPDDGKVSVARAQVQGMQDLAIVPVSHPFLMKREEVMQLTLGFLREGRFSSGQSQTAS